MANEDLLIYLDESVELPPRRRLKIYFGGFKFRSVEKAFGPYDFLQVIESKSGNWAEIYRVRLSVS